MYPKVQCIDWVFDPIIALLGPVCVGNPNTYMCTSSAACEAMLDGSCPAIGWLSYVTFYEMMVAWDVYIHGPFSFDVYGGFGLPVGAAAGRYYLFCTSKCIMNIRRRCVLQRYGGYGHKRLAASYKFVAVCLLSCPWYCPALGNIIYKKTQAKCRELYGFGTK